MVADSGSLLAARYLIGAILLLSGFVYFWLRYSVIIGGTKVRAKVVKHDAKNLQGAVVEVYSFEHKGKTLEISGMAAKHSPRPVGSPVMIYFNPKRPNRVAMLRPMSDAVIIMLVLCGAYMLFAPVSQHDFSVYLYVVMACFPVFLFVFFGRKYRAVLSGTKVDAFISGYEFVGWSGGKSRRRMYAEILSFEFDGKMLEIVSSQSSSSRKKPIGTQVKAYYNPKYINYIAPHTPVVDAAFIIASIAACVVIFMIIQQI